MKILNLYACLGGNRYKWDEVTNIEVTAIELDKELARLYQERFPNDKVIVTDAHQYLIKHYNYQLIYAPLISQLSHIYDVLIFSRISRLNLGQPFHLVNF